MTQVLLFREAESRNIRPYIVTQGVLENHQLIKKKTKKQNTV